MKPDTPTPRPVRGQRGQPPRPSRETVQEVLEDEISGWLAVTEAIHRQDWLAAEQAAWDGLVLARLRRRQLAAGRFEEVPVRTVRALRRLARPA